MPENTKVNENVVENAVNEVVEVAQNNSGKFGIVVGILIGAGATGLAYGVKWICKKRKERKEIAAEAAMDVDYEIVDEDGEN